MKKLSKDDLWEQVKSRAPKEIKAAAEEGSSLLLLKADGPEQEKGGQYLETAQPEEPETKENASPELSVTEPATTEEASNKKDETKALISEAPQDAAIAEIKQRNFHLDQAEPLATESFPNPPAMGSSSISATIPNVQHLIKSYDITARYNLIKKCPEFNLPGLVCTPDNADAVAMAHIKSLARLNGISVSSIEEVVATIADRSQHNPVVLWIQQKEWDGIDRLPEFYDTLTEAEDFPREFKEMLVFRWMLSAVAAVLMPQGFKARGVLTLQGRQSLGKTSWIRALVPDVALRESVVKLDHHLDAGDKDSKIAAATHWIVEIGELESSFRRDVSRLKGFITSDFDKIRVPYGRTASNFPRKTVFCATVNDNKFLVDSTGNTRFWVLPVIKIDYEHKINMQQVWAQCAVEYEKGEQWWLTAGEENGLEKLNRDHRVVSAIEERVMPVLDLTRKGEEGLPAMTPTQFLNKIGYRTVSNPQAKECGSLLREHLGEPKKINGSYKWRIPFAKEPDFHEFDNY